MSDDKKMSRILCWALEPPEQEKVERLDGPIFDRFSTAGHVVRLCRGRVDGDTRVLDFCTDPVGATVITSLSAGEFLTASDAEALAMIGR